MAEKGAYDAIVVGAGPNGLSAAIRLARANLSVLLVEAKETVGGGTRSARLTRRGYVHDVCSAIHPLAATSPFLSTLPLGDHGLELIHPDAPLAHPLDDGDVAVLERSVQDTADRLGSDGGAYKRLMDPLVQAWDPLVRQLLGPLRLPRHPLLMARFGLRGVRSAHGLAYGRFSQQPARALIAGTAGHAILPLEKPLTAAFGLVLAASGHAVGWPMAAGGSQSIADALAAYFVSLGGEVETGVTVTSLEQLPEARVILFDVIPKHLVEIAGDQLPGRYQKRIAGYRHGPGVFKMDFALSAPIPWKADDCARAATVHVGGRYAEIADSEREVAAGQHPERPFVILAQQSLFDPARAPKNKHTAWAYCHVPAGSDVDMSEAVENQIERFAPGFRDVIVAKSSMGPGELAAYNPNYVGGDISSGAHDGLQLFMRPTIAYNPYRTPNPKLFLCSAATPPGAGVHGMCGFHAAESALRRMPKR